MTDGGTRPCGQISVRSGRLGENVDSDEEAEEQDQRGGDEQLRAETAWTVVMYLRTRRAANWAASLDDRPGTVCADQVLAAHLGTPSAGGALAHLA
jgi:hypothetical protein